MEQVTPAGTASFGTLRGPASGGPREILLRADDDQLSEIDVVWSPAALREGCATLSPRPTNAESSAAWSLSEANITFRASLNSDADSVTLRLSVTSRSRN